MTSAAATVEKFMQASPEQAAALPWLTKRPQGAVAPWVKALRETGAESFAVTGLPALSWEGWQYTNLRALDAAKFSYTTASVTFDVKKLPAPLLQDAYRVVLVNGQFQKDLSSLPEHVTILSLMEAADRNIERLDEYLVNIGDLATQPFKALNSAHLRDGFVLMVAKGKDVDRPVEVLFYTTAGTASHPRAFYHLAQNSGVTILEHHAGDGAYFANTHIEAVVEQDARLKCYRIVDESDLASHISRLSLTLLKSAQFEGFSGAFGGALVRQDYEMKLLENAISGSISGIYLLRGRQSHDFSILADHFEEGGMSAQHFKGVVDDQARAIFQGKIHVRRPAQKTDGYQSHHALLLSKDAEASAKPELEIYADDVKCSHGATSGHLDEGALFYLRSRGIPEAEARALLIQSFIAEAAQRVSNEAIRAIYMDRVTAWLSARTVVS